MKAVPVMIQGTHSDAGKSMIVTALCRIFKQRGYRTAPFKSQNMALNSYITIDGKEIGRAQGVQAEAAEVEVTTAMNPVLIKPTRDYESQIVIHGKPLKNMKATEYRSEYYMTAKKVIKDAYQTLSVDYERIVIEGAGSPAEVNLNDRELVNMSVARLADAPVVLVGDIDKGGVFASLVGTLQLLEPEDRDRVVGVVINKFRGDLSLLESGLSWFEEYTGVPVLGVVPYLEDVSIDAEDSLSLVHYSRIPDQEKELDIAVIQFPKISNFTDIDPFRYEEDCHVRLVSRPDELGSPDLILLPGTKNTLEDRLYLREKGFDAKIKRAHRCGSIVFGICGGYQMMGETIRDPDQVESGHIETKGLELLPISTTLLQEKTTVRSNGTVTYGGQSVDVKGYEVHMGRTDVNSSYDAFIKLDNHHQEGLIDPERTCMGTYFHGIFHNDRFRHLFLNDLRKRKGLRSLEIRVFYERQRLDQYDLLADHVRKAMDIDHLEKIMKDYAKRKGTHHVRRKFATGNRGDRTD